jgi:L,D-peptidoglycan transpeptidase YkuD (ErfK/YbiS/YcfS/YnhG family)
MVRPAALILSLALVADCLPRRAVDREEQPPTTEARAPAILRAASATNTPAPAPSVTPTAAALAAAPGDPSCPARYVCDRGALDRSPRPTITEIYIRKRAHELHLVAGVTIVRSFSAAIGSGGYGYKRYEGDRVTPIGTYSITGRYPSRWHTYLSLSYPNDEDRARFAELVARGEVNPKIGPGSAIAVHGRRNDMSDKEHKRRDWTLGCIALDNNEIEEVAASAPVGTRVLIED